MFRPVKIKGDVRDMEEGPFIIIIIIMFFTLLLLSFLFIYSFIF